MQKKQKYFLIGVVAVLLCMSLLLGVIANVNGWGDKLRDFFMESTDTQSSGSNYVPNKTPVLVNPDDTSSDDTSGSDTSDSDTSGSLVAYKEVLNQDSDDIRVDYILDTEHNYTFYGIFTDALLPDTEYLIEWSMSKGEEYPLTKNLEVFYDHEYEKYVIFYNVDYKAEDGLLGLPLTAPNEELDTPISFLTNSFTFTSGSAGSTFALFLLYSGGVDQTHAENCVDLISDDLLFRISKVE